MRQSVYCLFSHLLLSRQFPARVGQIPPNKTAAFISRTPVYDDLIFPHPNVIILIIHHLTQSLRPRSRQYLELFYTNIHNLLPSNCIQTSPPPGRCASFPLPWKLVVGAPHNTMPRALHDRQPPEILVGNPFCLGNSWVGLPTDKEAFFLLHYRARMGLFGPWVLINRPRTTKTISRYALYRILKSPCFEKGDLDANAIPTDQAECANTTLFHLHFYLIRSCNFAIAFLLLLLLLIIYF